MSRADELRAELALMELEEKLSAAKEKAKSPSFAASPSDSLTELKAKVREARRVYREAREAAG